MMAEPKQYMGNFRSPPLAQEKRLYIVLSQLYKTASEENVVPQDTLSDIPLERGARSLDILAVTHEGHRIQSRKSIAQGNSA